MDAGRLERARTSLEGLSVGDAFGERFFGPPIQVLARIQRRELPTGTWRWTDDTAMALVLFDLLETSGELTPPEVAHGFAQEHSRDPMRGYGRGAHEILEAIARGTPFRVAAAGVFDGGSYGNGAAMRVAPVGAYFADDPTARRLAVEASAAPTHAHPEGLDGALIVAEAAAYCVSTPPNAWDRSAFFEALLSVARTDALRAGLRTARDLPQSADAPHAAQALGSGQRVSARDTVPFCAWCVARQPFDYEEALWQTVSGLGDRDTTAAIVGGVVACAVGLSGIPLLWRHSRESLKK